MLSTSVKIVLAALLLTLFADAGLSRTRSDFPAPQPAVEYPNHESLDLRIAQAPRFSLDQAVAKVRGQYGGKVIKAETTGKGDRAVHRIKILTEDGRVRTVRVDGNTGRIL